jgi:hypothetical protein
MTIKRGAGGSSLNPPISIRGLVDPGSPAFRLVKGEFWPKFVTTKDYCQRMEYVVENLRKLFEEGRASPTSTDEDGCTLLHVSRMPAFSLTLRNKTDSKSSAYYSMHTHPDTSVHFTG